jgi:hypothetical protein
MSKYTLMTISLEVTPEAKESLAAQAETRGLSLEAFLQSIVSAQAAAGGPAPPIQALAAQADDPDRTIDELFDLVPVPPEVGEGSAARRSWYR